MEGNKQQQYKYQKQGRNKHKQNWAKNKGQLRHRESGREKTSEKRRGKPSIYDLRGRAITESTNAIASSS